MVERVQREAPTFNKNCCHINWPRISFQSSQCKIIFDTLGIVLGKHQLTPDRIFNLDEICVITVQNPKKFVTATGTKTVGSWEQRSGDARGKLLDCMPLS